MASVPTSSFEPVLPESLEDRWIDYYTGEETSPYCDGSAVSLPYVVSAPLLPSAACPPSTTPEEAASMPPVVPPPAEGDPAQRDTRQVPPVRP
jgi:hypothetical protein